MRRNANVVVLLFVAALLPKLQVNFAGSSTLTALQDNDFERARADRLFVKALSDRIDTHFSREREKYDRPYMALKKREGQIREQIDQTRDGLAEVEKLLETKAEEERKLKKALKAARTEQDKAEISKALEKVEDERRRAELEGAAIRLEEHKLKDLLRSTTRMHFAEEKDLKVQLDRIDRQRTELSEKYSGWDTERTPQNYNALRDFLMRTAETAALTCNVSIRSELNSIETTGATIKYQTPEQRQFGKGTATATTAKCPTTCSEEMKPNRYYIWTERRNKPSSDPEQIFVVTSEKVSVRLQESSPP